MTSSSPQTRVRSISQYMDTNTAADPVPAYPYEVDVEDDEDIVVDPNVVDIVERESFTSALSPDITCQSPTTTPGLNAMSVSASTVPEPVRRFAAELQHAIRGGPSQLQIIQNLYDEKYNKITEQHFWTRPWPSVEAVSVFLADPDDKLFRALYKELYFRHIYGKVQLNAKKQPTIDQRLDSWNNYCNLFSLLLGCHPVDITLPQQWIWDILDEFIYQLQSFIQFRANIIARTADELKVLKEHTDAWSVPLVIGFLHALVHKDKEINSKSETTYPIYQALSTFSLIELCRLHCLLGDYYGALQTLEPLDIHEKAPHSLLLSCYTTQQYYIGFSYLMLRRYVDAVKAFAAILRHMGRARQYHQKSYQYDSIAKKNEQLYTLLAITISLCPQRVDEHVHMVLREKFADKLSRLQRGEESLFEELFSYASPKFISPALPDYDMSPALNLSSEPLKLQIKLFMTEVKQQIPIIAIRSYLRLYTSISVKKLAAFVETNEDTLRTQLLCYKHKTTSLVWTSGPLHTGKLSQSASEPDFYLEGDVVYVREGKASRGTADYFIRHIKKLNAIQP